MDKLQGMEQTVNEIRDALKKRGSASGASNTNTIKIEGAGSIWNGIAIGIALGAVIAGSVAVMGSLQQMNLRVQQAEAFQAALYMTSPRLAEAIDEDLDNRMKRKENLNQGQKNSP